MNVFYSTLINDDKIELIDQEAQHCIRVLRKGRGEQVHVIDGCGGSYVCELTDFDRRKVSLTITSKTHVDKDLNLPHLAFGMIKNQTRLEWMLEKVTEIGIDRIIPLICTRSERNKLKRDRLEKIIISATKQSLNPYLPVLEDPVNYSNFIIDQSRMKKYVASFGEGVPELANMSSKNEPSIILIGPEGDFTEEELTRAISDGFHRVNLGKTRLRAETACIVSCALLRYS